VFSPDELSLLISGVPSIDVEDWSRNTQVCPCNNYIYFIQLLRFEYKYGVCSTSSGGPSCTCMIVLYLEVVLIVARFGFLHVGQTSLGVSIELKRL
jgi:hypothetical protein